ncbi:MAG TPA: diaminopimelate decarboxylase [Planctomycetota bacterium]|nr:diaminopimelate decarboxylase [Planctomycetota bacterium]
MDYFNYLRGELRVEDVPAAQLAETHGTPLYVYSARTIIEHYRKLRDAFAGAGDGANPPLICYSVKANSNLSILKLMKDAGSGFDVVSGGELHRALKVGADPKTIVFAGVGKSDEEILYALEKGILLFNVESEEELRNIDRLAGQKGKVADVALRVNPDVDPQTHTYISTGKKETKFGVDLARAKRIVGEALKLKNIRMSGLHVHIGSQITKVDPYVETMERVGAFLPEVRAMGAPLQFLDIGGGFGIWYKDKTARPAAEIAGAMLPALRKSGCRILLEPGRFIVGNAGILLTRVLYVKESGDKKFVICDAGMNDLIRPTLYSAYHRVWPVRTDPGHSGEVPDEEQWGGPGVTTDLVGPICESGDFFAKERKLPPLKRGDLVCVFSAGAYGYVMASNYNSHPRPAEVMVAGSNAQVVTARESMDDLLRNERVVPFSLT